MKSCSHTIQCLFVLPVLTTGCASTKITSRNESVIEQLPRFAHIWDMGLPAEHAMAAQGLRKLGSGTTDAAGSKGPGEVLGLVTLIATLNPAGLIIGTGVKVYKKESGSSTVEGRAKQTAKEIADVLKTRFQEQGWIN
jgi:hypothetical protein